MATYTFRVHRFNLVDGEDKDINENNNYFLEDVDSDSVDTALTSLREKYGDENQARIFLRAVN